MRFLAVLLGSAALLAPRLAAETIRIGTLPGLRFDVAAFSVRPGAEVEIVFSNTDEMLHNFVVTKPGTREAVVEAALALGAGAADRDYVPASPDVLWATKVVPSGSSATLKFTAPAEPGDYPYVCTFPGHGLVMFGTMIVTPNPRPPVLTPKELPGENAAAPMDHSGHVTHVRVLRIFMPDAGPASIAVQLPNGYSYCWDAGACRFRYAWRGGGTIERTERGTAKLLGADVFYRGEAEFPLRTGLEPGARPAEIEFKGYVLDAHGVPEFIYTVDGVNIRERVDIDAGRVTRRFRTSADNIWFTLPDEQSSRIASAGVREGEFHRFAGPAARDFTITYAPAAP